jgi:hypothetical protein
MFLLEKTRATGKNRTTVDEEEIPAKRQKEQKRKRGHSVQPSLASLPTSSSLMDMDVNSFYDMVSLSVLQFKLFQLIVINNQQEIDTITLDQQGLGKVCQQNYI